MIMSTSIIVFHQTFNANDVDIMEFEPCVLSKPHNLSKTLPRGRLGRLRHIVPFCCRDSRSMSSLPSEADVSLQLNVSREIDLMGRDIEALIDSQPVLKKDLKASLLKRRSEMEEMKKAMEKMDESLETSQVRVVMANQILRRSNVLTAAREREHETNRFEPQSVPDNSDLRLIRMYLRPPFREDLNNIIRLIRISPYS